MAGYAAKLKDGREIYIPSWPVDVALENLASAGKYLGSENVINISELNMASVIVAIMKSEVPAKTAELVAHFVCSVRIDGSKIEPATVNTMFADDLKGVAEMFAHVIHAQYADFFESGLVKEHSPVK